MSLKKHSRSELLVWVIDDDEINLAIARNLLEQLGVTRIHTETRASRAIELLASLALPPDLVIVDLYMPDIDGIELVAELAKLKFSGGVILVSGVNAEMLAAARQLALAGGINLLAAWEKPLRIDALAAVLENQVSSADPA